MGIEEWTRWYRSQDINLIPLREGEKTPILVWNEFKKRPTLDREVEEWLARGIKNFGAICGSISNNLLVIDVDEKELFSKLNIGELASKTFTVKTGKGYHIYLRMSDPKKKGLVWEKHEEIRFQGEGKYVVAAGSKHPSGVIYEPLNTSPKEIKSVDSGFLDEIEQRWKKYHGIDEIEKKKETIRFETKRSDSIEDFKKRVSLTKVVKQYVSKERDYLTYWQGCCPFSDHWDRVPSFTVYEDVKCYRCFGCGRRGDVINFIEEKEGKSFVDAIKRIEEITGVEYFPKKKKGKEKEKEKRKEDAEKKVDEEKTKDVERKINPSDVDELIRAKRRLATLKDTEEVLHYENTSGGAWRFDAEVIISEETEKILKVLGRRDKVTRYFVNEVLGHVQRSTYINREWLNTEKEKINLLNGVYDLETEQLLAHDAGYYFTYIIPVRYDAEADCPRVKKFLRQILDEDEIQTVLQFIGYCMLPIMSYHKALMFLGEGANGKSTLIELIRRFLGKKNTSSHSLQSIIGERFTKADLYGRLANLYADIPVGALRQTGIFKILTGGDMLSAEKKFKEPFMFQNTAKLVFSANVLPETMDDTDAFFRRWLIITFPNKFEGNQCDPKILEKITTPEELSGLLNLVLDALKQLLRDGRFYTSKVAAEIREEYIDKSNPIHSFVLNSLEADPDSFERKDEVYSAFIKFCRERKLPDVDKRKFGARLPRYVPVKEEKKRLSGTRVFCWRGLRLKKKEEEQNSLEEQTYEHREATRAYVSETEKTGDETADTTPKKPTSSSSSVEGDDGRGEEVQHFHNWYLVQRESAEDPPWYVCGRCFKKAPSKPEGRYSCVCGMRFESPSEMIEHKSWCEKFQDMRTREGVK